MDLISREHHLNIWIPWMSEMEKKGIDWDKNMEEEFIGFVFGMIKFFPFKFYEKKSSLGIMTIIANSK